METKNIYKKVGNLWNGFTYQVISNRIDYYVLNNEGWNGEYYFNCW